MSKNTNVYFSYTPQHSPAKFLSTDTVVASDGSSGTLKTVVTPGANDCIVRKLSITSTDTVAHDVLIFMVDASANKYLLGAIGVPAGSGSTSAASPVNVLDKTKLPSLRLDQNGNTFIQLKTGWTLQVGFTTAVSSGKNITVNSTSEDF